MAYPTSERVSGFVLGTSVQLRLALGIIAIATLAAGCSKTSFQIVDSQTDKPLVGVQAKLIRQRTLFEEVITEAAGTITVSTKKSDDTGHVSFHVPSEHWVDFRSPVFHFTLRKSDDGRWQYEGDVLWVRMDEMTGDVTIGANVPSAASTSPAVIFMNKLALEEYRRLLQSAVRGVL